MNWLIKIAGTTFFIQDAQRIAKPKSLTDIANHMMQWMSSYMPKNLLPDSKCPRYQFITPDGDYIWDNSYTGVINIYTCDESPQDILTYVEQYIREELLPSGIQSQIQKGPLPQWVDRSKMYDVPVWRLLIKQNETSSLTNIPQANFTTRNTQVLLTMLGLDAQYHEGRIDPADLKQRIQKAYTKVDAFTISDEAKQDGGASAFQQMFSGEEYNEPSEEQRNLAWSYNKGLTAEDLTRKLQSLEQIADFCLQHGFHIIAWN